jgi:hypothetical protein
MDEVCLTPLSVIRDDLVADCCPARYGDRPLGLSWSFEGVNCVRAVLRQIASLKVAVVLLLALAIVMALASVHEARHGTESALRDVYGARWFAALMAAIGANVLAALWLRWPFRWSQIGFVTSHVAVLVILVGALITKIWGVDGRLWLRPQETRADFDGEQWVLMLGLPDGTATVNVPVDVSGPLFDPAEAGQQVAGVSWAVEQFAADTIDEGERVVPDPNAPQPAVKIRLGHGQHQHDQWILGGRPAFLGGLRVRFLRVTDPKVLTQVLQPTTHPDRPQRGRLVVELRGTRHLIDADTQLNQVVPLGETGYRVQIRRYLPHALVSGRELRSASSRPVNPMIEFDLIDPMGKAELHRLFARFPDQDFAAAHATSTRPASAPAAPAVTFRYVDATVLSHQSNHIDLFVDGQGKLHGKFSDADGRTTATALELNRPVATPWPQMQLTALELMPRARNERSLKPIPPRKANAVPAAFICLRASKAAHRLWVRRGESYDVHIGGQHVQVGFVPERIPMGFSIQLLKPIITHYPGTDRARTYESHVRVNDPNRGVKLEQTISMNAPLVYGGYSYYQSSYQFGKDNEPVATMLSVVSDPGKPVVYIGYVGLMVGMLVALAQKIRRRSRSQTQTTTA